MYKLFSGVSSAGRQRTYQILRLQIVVNMVKHPYIAGVGADLGRELSGSWAGAGRKQDEN